MGMESFKTEEARSIERTPDEEKILEKRRGLVDNAKNEISQTLNKISTLDHMSKNNDRNSMNMNFDDLESQLKILKKLIMETVE